MSLFIYILLIISPAVIQFKSAIIITSFVITVFIIFRPVVVVAFSPTLCSTVCAFKANIINYVRLFVCHTLDCTDFCQ